MNKAEIPEVESEDDYLERISRQEQERYDAQLDAVELQCEIQLERDK